MNIASNVKSSNIFCKFGMWVCWIWPIFHITRAIWKWANLHAKCKCNAKHAKWVACRVQTSTSESSAYTDNCRPSSQWEAWSFLLDVGKLLREFQADQTDLRGVNDQNEKEANYYVGDCMWREVKSSFYWHSSNESFVNGFHICPDTPVELC